MNHAVVVNGEPEILTGRVFTKGDGTWLPLDALDNMPRAEKLEMGVYEVEPVSEGSGPVLVGPPVLSVAPEGDRVLSTTTRREKTAAELDTDEEAVANDLINSDLGVVLFAFYKVMFAMRKESNPNMGSAQFRNFVTAAVSAADVNQAGFKTVVRDLI